MLCIGGVVECMAEDGTEVSSSAYCLKCNSSGHQLHEMWCLPLLPRNGHRGLGCMGMQAGARVAADSADAHAVPAMCSFACMTFDGKGGCMRSLEYIATHIGSTNSSCMLQVNLNRTCCAWYHAYICRALCWTTTAGPLGWAQAES